MNGFKYDVFLSYRHKPLDAEVTRSVFRYLENYRLPKALRAAGHHGVKRVFRDTEELPVSQILSHTIEDALEHTRFLVVVCSPETPSSEWVDREVATFIEMGRADQIFPLLISGSPEESFPRSLVKIPDIAERTMDARTAEGTGRAIIKQSHPELLKVIAAVAQCSQEDLVREDHLRRQNTVIRSAAAVIALLLLVAGVTGCLWTRAEKDRQKTLLEQEASMEVLTRLTFGLPDRLSEQPGTYPQIAKILSDNAEQIRRILQLSPDSGEVRQKIAENEERLSVALSRTGEYETAEQAARRAIEIYEEAAKEDGRTDTIYLNSAKNNLGTILTAAGRYEEASALFREVLADTKESETELRASALGNLGRCLLLLGDFGGAAEALEEAVAFAPADSAGQLANAAARLNLGLARMQAGQYEQAEEQLRVSADLYETLLKEYGSRNDRVNALHADSALGDCLTRQGRLDEAEEVFAAAAASAEELARDQTNAEIQAIYGELCNNYGLCLNQQGRFREADHWYRTCAECQERLYASSETLSSAEALSLAWYNIAENAFKAQDRETTKDYFRRSLDLSETLYDAMGTYQQGEYLARSAYYEIIVEQDFARAAEKAREAYRLAPDSAFVLYNLGYALLFHGERADAEKVFLALASLGEGAVRAVELDFEAMGKAGLDPPAAEEILTLMREAAGS